MKFKDYVNLITDNGAIPIPRFRWELRKNTRKTAREEAILGEVIRQANPRQNISGRHPWGPEEDWVLQQLWLKGNDFEWRDVPKKDQHLYSTVETEFGELPVPNALKPGVIPMDLREKLREILE